MEQLFGMNPIFFFQAIMGISLVILGAIMKKYPPKKINHLYGYRTKSSMKSQERWDHAQEYSSMELIKQGLFIALLGIVLGLATDMDTMTSVVVFVLILTGGFAALAIKTERSLKDTFK